MNNHYKTYISGGLSGIVEIFFIHPIEYYKTIKQTNPTPINFNQFVFETYRKNNIFGFYKGFYPRLVGIIPMRTMFWGSLFTAENKLNKLGYDRKHIPLLSGLFGGFNQTLIDCPIESLKTKMMVKSDKVQLNFNGMIPNMARNIGFAICFMYGKRNINIGINNKFTNDIVVGSISGVSASVITQPFDYLKTQKQYYGNKKTLLSIIKNTNLRTFYSGGLSRAIITCLSMSIGLPVFNYINQNL